MAVATFTKSGNKATTPAKLDKAVFAVEVKNHELLKSAYLAHLANGRLNLAKALKRGEVSGGGKKPWKQKGTGRARFGSSRNPIWRGGGAAFGPTGNENYQYKLNSTAKLQALRQALSVASSDNRIFIIEDIKLSGKTKELTALLKKVGLQGRITVVVADKTAELSRASSNLADVSVVQAKYLNTRRVMDSDALLVTNEALAQVSEWLGGKA